MCTDKCITESRCCVTETDTCCRSTILKKKWGCVSSVCLHRVSECNPHGHGAHTCDQVLWALVYMPVWRKSWVSAHVLVFPGQCSYKRNVCCLRGVGLCVMCVS